MRVCKPILTPLAMIITPPGTLHLLEICGCTPGVPTVDTGVPPSPTGVPPGATGVPTSEGADSRNPWIWVSWTWEMKIKHLHICTYIVDYSCTMVSTKAGSKFHSWNVKPRKMASLARPHKIRIDKCTSNLPRIQQSNMNPTRQDTIEVKTGDMAAWQPIDWNPAVTVTVRPRFWNSDVHGTSQKDTKREYWYGRCEIAPWIWGMHLPNYHEQKIAKLKK